jgi:acyl dehydratase
VRPLLDVFRAPEGVVFYAGVGAQVPLSFDDIKVGEEFISPGRTVTEMDVVLFAGLSGDYNVLHTDAEHMKSSQFGERIAHGLLVLSIQQGLLSRIAPELVELPMAELAWKFRRPIKIGDTVHVVARVSDKRSAERAGWGLVTIARRVMNQRGEVVQEGESEHMVERRLG